MTAPTLERALTLAFGHEGGFQNDKRDKGNWTGGGVGKGVLKGTKYGISAASYPLLDIKGLTLAKAAEIYRRDYWGKVRGDGLPAGVDYAVFDFAINSGPAKAAMVLQKCVGVAEDGKVGPLTLAAVNKAVPQLLISRICAERLAFLRTLSTWPVYGRGWETRVRNVEREALNMAAAPILDVEPIETPKTTWLVSVLFAFAALFKRKAA